MTEYIDDLYANPAATDMFDIIVQDSALAGSDRDFGNLFAFGSFDPCYPNTTLSATAATDGGPIGATVGYGCDFATSLSPQFNTQLNLRAYPNPFQGTTKISFTLEQSTRVALTVYDITGKRIATIMNGLATAGEQQLEWNGGENLSAGLYVLKLDTEKGFMTQKLILNNSFNLN